MKKMIFGLIVCYLAFCSFVLVKDYSRTHDKSMFDYENGCTTLYIDKKLKVQECTTNKGYDGTEHSVLYFDNLTQSKLRVKFRCKVWYNCSNYRQSGFISDREYDEWTETIYINPEDFRRYVPTKDYIKTCTCPTYLQEFELIEYASKELENKEVKW